MNYARGLLQKYGWTEGKGLGKNESGIAEPLKPNLKFDTTGIGHDHSDQFTFNWWELAFNKAASRIEVGVSDSDGTVIRTNETEELLLTTKRPWIAKLKNENCLKYGSFVKTETLTNDGQLIPMKSKPTISYDEPVVSLSDEELFRICGGRTAHKAARHGHKLVGKLARVNEQEKKLETDTDVESIANSKKSISGNNNKNELSHLNIKKKKKRKEQISSETSTEFICENVKMETAKRKIDKISKSDGSHETCQPRKVKKKRKFPIGEVSCLEKREKKDGESDKYLSDKVTACSAEVKREKR